MVEIYGYSIATIPLVAAIVYGIIEFLKHFVFNGYDRFGKYIPVFSTIIGALITLIMFFFSPDFVPVANWYSAVLMGAASGLSAVGINQIKKQSQKKEDNGGGS